MEEVSRQPNPFAANTSSPKEGKEKQPEVDPIPEKLAKVYQAIDELKDESVKEKVQLLIRAFDDEWKVFKEKLGEDRMRKALQKFLQEELQGKLSAARSIKP
jgi:hypothetical protein